MSKTKAPKAPKSKPAKKAKASPAPKAVQAGDCPHGGNHESEDENGERFCTKCKEPEPKKREEGKAR